MTTKTSANGTGRLTREPRCECCGTPSDDRNAHGHCPRCAELAQHADAYGATVALDLLRATATEALSYAPAADLLRVVREAIEDASTG